MMANNYYGWNYGGVVDHFGGCYPTPPTYSMTQAVAYPNVPYSASQYGPYGTIITSPVVQNVAIRGPATGQPSLQDGAQQQPGKTGAQRAGELPLYCSNASSNSGGSQPPVTPHDNAFYNAAKNLLEDKHVGQKKVWGNANKDRFRSGRGPVIESQQWKYCELCKCTCAGEQAYKAHLVGKAHKKKEALGSSTAMALAGSKGHMYCQLCEVSCSSSDAYDAHIKGAKHQKVMKVQMKMGKYVPDSCTDNSGHQRPAKIAKLDASSSSSSYSKINFIGSNLSNVHHHHHASTGKDSSESSAKHGEAPDSVDEAFPDRVGDDPSIGPIGLEYITEQMNETNTAPMFHCKLCDCSFSDPLAKMMHSKGRRHRIQYKKKVDPSFKVESPSTVSDRLKNQWRNKRKESSDNYRQQAEYLRYEKDLLEWQLMKTQNPDMALYPDPCGGGSGSAQPSMTTSSYRDNQHVMAKHGQIYPSEDELKAVQEFVSTCERSLKMVSDKLADKENGRMLKGVMRVGLLAKGLLIKDLLRLELVILTSEKPTKRLLRTVAEEMPEQMKTFSKRSFIVELSPDVSHLKVRAAEGEEDTKDSANDRDIRFSSYNITCLIFVASSTEYTKQKSKLFGKGEESASDLDQSSDRLPENLIVVEPMAEPVMEEYVDDVIAEWALGELMRTKWFQINSMSSPACSIVVRIMMDFCRRIPTWTPLGQWALELLVERCMSTSPQMSPAAGLRRIFEVVSSGIFLQDGWGLVDICEDSSVVIDAVAHMCPQEREDITNSSQHALRLLAFGLIYKVLGMAKLPPPSLMSMVERD